MSPRARPPLQVSRAVSGWLDENMQQPTTTVDHGAWIFDELLRAAAQLNSPTEADREQGRTTFALAARLIVEHDAAHYFRMEDARRARAPKAARAELVEKMRRYRQNNPDKTLKQFIADAADITLEIDGQNTAYLFEALAGEYRVKRLDQQWAEASKPPRP